MRPYWKRFGNETLAILNILLGIGLLSLPYGMGKSGWAGLSVLGVVGCIQWFSAYLLAENTDTSLGMASGHQGEEERTS